MENEQEERWSSVLHDQLDSVARSPIEKILVEISRSAIRGVAEQVPIFPISKGVKVLTVLSSSHICSAAAAQKNASNRITIHWGIICALWNLSIAMILRGRTLNQIFGWHTPHSRQIGSKLAISHTRAEAPVGLSDTAVQYVAEIVGRALEAVWCHEYAHHVRGHFAFIRSRKIDEALNMAEIRRPTSGKEVVRDIELDADYFGIDILWKYNRLTAIQSGRIGANGQLDSDWATSELGIRSISLIALHMIFDAQGWAVEDQSTLSHPAPIHRAIRVVAFWRETHLRQVDLGPDAIDPILNIAWETASDVASALELEEGRWDGWERPEKRMQIYKVEEERVSAVIREFSIKAGMLMPDLKSWRWD